MNINEFRQQMNSYWQAANEEAALLKDSYLILDRLHALYQKLDIDERMMADQILAEWTLSDDEKLRFDALVLIDDFQVVSAMPALRGLATRLETTHTPGAPYELQKVNRIIRDLPERKKREHE